jgi:hypothetical protein
MKPNRFNFPRIKRRNNFTKIFGNVGKRRTLKDFRSHVPHHLHRILFWTKMWLRKQVKRTKMQMHRRAAQGWRNQTYGRMQAMKIRLQYGRRKVIRRFIK